jgi:RNA-directed DNA polymerase
LLSNVALGVLDEFIAREPGGPATSTVERRKRRRHGQPNFKLTRYADDWCLMVHGTRADAAGLRGRIAGVLATMGLRLSEEKTLITHIDEGLDFLGWRIQRHRKRGTGHRYVYTYPAKKALLAITAKVKMICRMSRNRPLAALIHQLNPVVRGWCAYFRPGVSSKTFSYLRGVIWRLVMHWLRRKHGNGRAAPWKDIRRRYCDGGWWPHDGEVKIYNPAAVRITRYRYRGTTIPSPW